MVSLEDAGRVIIELEHFFQTTHLSRPAAMSLKLDTSYGFIIRTQFRQSKNIVNYSTKETHI